MRYEKTVGKLKDIESNFYANDDLETLVEDLPLVPVPNPL
jgi:hypothetical protein